MIDNLQEITLGTDALDYVRRFLFPRKRQLSRSLREKIELDLGKIKTYLPPTSTREAIHQFEFGGKLPQPLERTVVGGGYTVPIPNLDDALIAKIQAHLSGDDSSLCIFENGVIRPQYPAVNRLPKRLHTFTCEDTVCHYLTANDKDSSDLIRLTIRVARSPAPPYLVGCATKLFAVTLYDNGSVPYQDLEKAVESVEQIFLGAYDGEGFLIWAK
jgi:hypothetical protein